MKNIGMEGGRKEMCDTFESSDSTIEAVRRILLEHGYVMKERIGGGRNSAVYRVYSQRYKCDFAAKAINIQSTKHCDALATVIREEEALKALNHPQVMRLYDSVHDDTFRVLILELCSSKSLKQLIQESQPVANLQVLIAQISNALTFVHSRGFVHRDIKPENILMDDYGRPKLADFGRSLSVPERVMLTDFNGSRHYSSPEILANLPYDPFKADIWALGVTFYEMAMGTVRMNPNWRMITQANIQDGIAMKKETPPMVRKIVKAMTYMRPWKRANMDTIAKFPELQTAMTVAQCRLMIGTRKFDLPLLSKNQPMPSNGQIAWQLIGQRGKPSRKKTSLPRSITSGADELDA
jgi:serine/threonine protein kinase